MAPTRCQRRRTKMMETPKREGYAMKTTQRTDDQIVVKAPLLRWRAIWAGLGSLALCLLLSGCGSKPPPAQPAADVGPAAQQPAPGLPGNIVLPEAAEPKMVRSEAQVGAGAKGRGYKPGMITTPVATYFKAKEKIAFEIQIPHAMGLHKGLYGSAPTSHEEFMEQIISEGDIKLPELPEGHTYVYDPKTEKLLVEHPK
jgi:hypothetical protein